MLGERIRSLGFLLGGVGGAGLLFMALLVGCSPQEESRYLGPDTLDERVMEASILSAESYQREGGIAGDGPGAPEATLSDYWIGAPIPQFYMEGSLSDEKTDYHLERLGFNCYPLLQEGRLVALQYVDDWLDTSSDVDGNYSRIVRERLSLFEEFVADKVPLAQVTLAWSDGTWQEWLVRPDGTGVLVDGDESAVVGVAEGKGPTVEPVPDELAAVLGQLDFSDPSDIREFTLEER
ncbi:hypothetical protein N1614_04825 [Adlercreutzia muris]|uniref:Uncharacterized protein n=1 Tax=Adlercreutzia muris TaxID=1796610 RepID=A0A7C8BX23_9ACTN|nr:hypothetical protein [Adlercreutzia muris]KAB1651092.1 hypothetical protein F8D48_02275 [Adlercreutzia muris]MCR2028433.1 hypothetical protein [Adlercreutzia muris]MCU7584670.1 hypothetical protein [Adlercreutzia muris]